MNLHTGSRVGRWTLKRYISVPKHPKWEAQCDCGTVKAVDSNSLKTGASQSCGCLRRELVRVKNLSHGKSKTALYRVWASMLERCEKKICRSYPEYGGRGIKVCPRWHSFSNFLEDVGDRPSPKHSLDRIRNDGDYEPSNVRWATYKEQARNKRNNTNLTFNGKTQCIAQWAEELGVNRSTISTRLRREKLSVDKALTKPVGRWAKGAA